MARLYAAGLIAEKERPWYPIARLGDMMASHALHGVRGRDYTHNVRLWTNFAIDNLGDIVVGMNELATVLDVQRGFRGRQKVAYFAPEDFQMLFFYACRQNPTRMASQEEPEGYEARHEVLAKHIPRYHEGLSIVHDRVDHLFLLVVESDVGPELLAEFDRVHLLVEAGEHARIILFFRRNTTFLPL